MMHWSPTPHRRRIPHRHPTHRKQRGGTVTAAAAAAVPGTPFASHR